MPATSPSESADDMDKDRECVADGHCRPPHRSRKDRARWCRGKVGVEHQWQWVDAEDLPNATNNGKRKPFYGERLGYRRERRVCITCSKQHVDTRRVCHCGTVFVISETGRYRAYSAGHCPSCDYMRDWHEGKWVYVTTNRGKKRTGSQISPPHKPPCRCEMAEKTNATQ